MMRHEDLHAVDDAAEIDRQGAVPGLELGIVGRAAPADAGIVAQDVDPAEDRERLVGGGAQLRAVGNVDLDEMNGVGAGQRRLRRREMGLVMVGDDDLHPLAEKAADHAEADAARTAGDEGHLAAQLAHRPSLPRILSGSLRRPPRGTKRAIPDANGRVGAGRCTD